ncbi:peptidase domain-containing ABC transporter [Bacillus thuringiensis]|uniref:Transporter n=1 Tax=Bacillus thuringiensis TaxID=1428 RepID=A0ABD6R526_BACTU|nr:peptidase domain-containing ABC transporter [Bacillus thuringiensis]OPD49249.1 transporter [Bacillus thuringiensis]
MKIHFQQQSEHSECGLACAAMIVDYYVKKTKLSILRKEYGVPNGGYNLHQLSIILKDNGLVSKAVKVNADSVYNLPTPFIAYWNNKHFVVVEKVSRNTFYIADPALGKIRVGINEFRNQFSNIALIVTEGKMRKLRLPKLNEKILNCFKDNKMLLGKTFIISLVMQCLSLMIPYLVQYVIDQKNIYSHSKSFPIIGVSILVFLAYFLTNMARIRMITVLQTTFDKDLLSSTIDHLLKLPYSFFVNRSKGELIYRINSNTYIRQILTDNGISLAVNAIFFFLYLGIMFSFNKVLTLVTLSIAFILCIVSVVNAKVNRKIYQNQMVVLTKAQDIINELINNIFTIKSTNSQKNIFNQWHSNFSSQIELERKKAKYSSYLVNIPQTIQTFYPLIIFVIGLLLSMNSTVTIGNVVAFSVLGVAFLSPILSIMNSYNQLEMVKVYLDRLVDILDTPAESELFGQEVLSDLKGRLTLNNVSYKYSKFSNNAVSDIILDIEAKENVAIVGTSGSGKSTVLKLLSCLYQPTEGTVYYDSKETTNLDIDSIREKIGVVLQENVLFNGSLRDNITMGRNFSDEEVWECIDGTRLTELVKQFPLGLETNISESGQNLSGGQRQKISIARTIISKPKAIFLDEPTSALDNISEKSVMETLFKLDATLIVVAHRLSTIENFDKIIVMHEGKVVGIGSHKQLLKENIYYQKLYQINEEDQKKDNSSDIDILVG